MNRVAATLVALLLLATGAAYALHLDRMEAPAAAVAPAADGHDHAGHAHEGGKAARFARAAEGRVPGEADLAALERHGTIALRPGDAWSPAAGVDSGTGVAGDPYVIDGVRADVLYIADVDGVEFEVRNSWIGKLVLDWHGDAGLVHHNRIQSLQVNRNVERTGGPSAAVIAHNHIDRITQLRHFDGWLVDNVVGRPDLAGLPAVPASIADPRNVADKGVVFDFAGFNGAEVARNVIYGGVDVKIHGHHHDDGTGSGSHNHGAADAAQDEVYAELHGERHHRLDFHDNVIVDPLGFGLRYNDRNHAGDDRQATSEQEPALEQPHTHYTRVAFRNNTIDGAPLRVEVFMAPDELHVGGAGALLVEGNRVVNATVRDGILVAGVRDAAVAVRGNVVEKSLDVLARAGVRAMHLQNSTLLVEGNRIDGFVWGVAAHDFDANTTWAVVGNRITGAERDVWWDETVANAPEGEAPPREHEHGAAPGRRDQTTMTLPLFTSISRFPASP